MTKIRIDAVQKLQQLDLLPSMLVETMKLEIILTKMAVEVHLLLNYQLTLKINKSLLDALESMEMKISGLFVINLSKLLSDSDPNLLFMCYMLLIITCIIHFSYMKLINLLSLILMNKKIGEDYVLLENNNHQLIFRK
jgi:hypothetical protein